MTNTAQLFLGHLVVHQNATYIFPSIMLKDHAVLDWVGVFNSCVSLKDSSVESTMKLLLVTSPGQHEKMFCGKTVESSAIFIIFYVYVINMINTRAGTSVLLSVCWVITCNCHQIDE